jgi:hypothetical protein
MIAYIAAFATQFQFGFNFKNAVGQVYHLVFRAVEQVHNHAQCGTLPYTGKTRKRLYGLLYNA